MYAQKFDFVAQNEIFLKLGTAAESARNHTLAIHIEGEVLDAMGYNGGKILFFLAPVFGRISEILQERFREKNLLPLEESDFLKKSSEYHCMIPCSKSMRAFWSNRYQKILAFGHVREVSVNAVGVDGNLTTPASEMTSDEIVSCFIWNIYR